MFPPFTLGLRWQPRPSLACERVTRALHRAPAAGTPPLRPAHANARRRAGGAELSRFYSFSADVLKRARRRRESPPPLVPESTQHAGTATHIAHSFGSTPHARSWPRRADDRTVSNASQEAAEERAHRLKEIRISEQAQFGLSPAPSGTVFVTSARLGPTSHSSALAAKNGT